MIPGYETMQCHIPEDSNPLKSTLCNPLHREKDYTEAMERSPMDDGDDGAQGFPLA
jgi:hypothetical protein